MPRKLVLYSQFYVYVANEDEFMNAKSIFCIDVVRVTL